MTSVCMTSNTDTKTSETSETYESVGDSKYDYFVSSIMGEINGKETHFLRVGGITKNFLEGEQPSESDDKCGYREATRRSLQSAIWQFYNEFKREDYESFMASDEIPKPLNVITSIVWAKFREILNEWVVRHRVHLKKSKEEIKKWRDELIQKAHLKQQAREKAQQLIMGNGDLKKGRDAFVERMKKQKAAKLNKVTDVSLQLEEEFAKWLTTPEAALYTKPMTNNAPTQFKKCETYGISRNLPPINLKVNSISGVVSALQQLSSHQNANSLTIEAVLAWDEKEAFTNPHAHVITDNVVRALNSASRVIQNEKMRVIGFAKINGKSYIVTPKISNSYLLFPKRFVKLEYRNKKITTRSNILYNVDTSLARLQVTRVYEGAKTVMNIDIMYNGTNTVDANQIFESNVIRELKNESNNALARKIKEKEQRVRAARRNGKKSSRQKNTWNVGGVGNTKNTSHDTINQIMRLCEFFENGLISEEQFEASKKIVLNT